MSAVAADGGTFYLLYATCPTLAGMKYSPIRNTPSTSGLATRAPGIRPYLLAGLASVLATVVLLPWRAEIALVNTAMLLLLAVALVAARLGRGPAILSSFFCVLAFDVGFVPPRGSLGVEDAQYLIVFAVMLAVALIVSQISGSLRHSSLQAQASADHQRVLYELAAALNATLRSSEVVAVVSGFLAAQYAASTHLHAADATKGDHALPDVVVQSVAASGQPAQVHDGDAQRPVRNIQPLQGATRLRGVLEVRLPLARAGEADMRAQTLTIVAGLTAAALERLHYVEVATRAQAEVDAERLRNTLLSTLSHDLRTPLTVLHGHADRLREQASEHPALALEAAAVCDEALRVNRLCDSLLDLARLRGTPQLLRREWVALEEIVGAALASLRGVRGVEQVQPDLADELPWLQLDALMFERVIANLVDNALKQGNSAQRVTIAARCVGTHLTLTVANTGSRFPADATGLLQPFVRGVDGMRADASPGFGLGLSICKAMVEAHGGTITLQNSDTAAEVVLSLPLPRQPMPQPPTETDITEGLA